MNGMLIQKIKIINKKIKYYSNKRWNFRLNDRLRFDSEKEVFFNKKLLDGISQICGCKEI